MEFNGIFEHIGELGLYQLLLFFSLGTINFFNGMQGLAPNFFYAPMDHWCKVPRLQNFSFETQRHVSIPFDGDGDYDSCKMYDLDYSLLSNDDILTWNRSVVDGVDTIDCSEWVYDQSEFASTIILKYNLVCDRSLLAELTSTIYMAGVLVGSLVSGALSDRFGRKTPMLVACLGYVAFATAQGFAPNYPVFAVFRFLNAVFNMTAWMCSYIIILEIMGPKHYVMIGTVIQNIYSLGIMVVAGVAYAIRDDRWFFVATGVPIACSFLFIWSTHESPRWQVANGQIEKAEKNLKYVADVNRNTLPENIDWTQNEKKDEQPRGSWGDLCHSPILCKELALIYLNWFTCSLVYYGVSYNAGAFGDVFLNTFLSGVIELPANFLCWVCLAYAGRRWANGGSLIVTGVFCLACVPVTLVRPDMEALLTGLSTIGKGAITFAFSSVYLYSTELFPTPVRQLALGTASMFGRFGSMASPYLGRALEDVWAPMPSLIFGVLALFTGLMMFLLPETKGHPIPDTIEDAENIGRKRTPTEKSGPTDYEEIPDTYKHGELNKAYVNEKTQNDTKFPEDGAVMESIKL